MRGRGSGWSFVISEVSRRLVRGLILIIPVLAESDRPSPSSHLDLDLEKHLLDTYWSWQQGAAEDPESARGIRQPVEAICNNLQHRPANSNVLLTALRRAANSNSKSWTSPQIFAAKIDPAARTAETGEKR